MKFLKCLLILCVLCTFTACSDHHLTSKTAQQKPMNNLTLYFNKETGAEFAARTQSGPSNPLPTSTTTFYSLDWDKNPIDVRIEHGENSITLHHVIGQQTSVASSQDMITSHSVYAGLTNNSVIEHDQARLTLLKIFKDLKQAGWHRFIRLSDPRLNGKDALEYASKEFYELDPDYAYSLEEWMALEDGSSWIFQANGLYLTIRLSRERGKADTQKEGGYFVSCNFVSEKKHYAPLFKDPDIQKWRTNAKRWVALFVGAKKEMNRIRAQKEVELKAQGMTIDESYEDPALVSKQ